MTNRDKIVDEAFNLAIAHIQKALNIDDGGFASMYWCGIREDTMVAALSNYYDAEVMMNGIED